MGGRRVPVTGRQRGDAPDVEHPIFSIEVKHRETLPVWLYEAMGQAEASVRGEQIPLVILHKKGQPIAECLTVMRLQDILKLMEVKQ